MPYIVDRQHGLYGDDVVAVINVRQRRWRSRVILSDNSLYHTLTRPKTFLRYLSGPSIAIVQVGARRRRGVGGSGPGATGQKQP